MPATDLQPNPKTLPKIPLFLILIFIVLLIVLIVIYAFLLKPDPKVSYFSDLLNDSVAESSGTKITIKDTGTVYHRGIVKSYENGVLTISNSGSDEVLDLNKAGEIRYISVSSADNSQDTLVNKEVTVISDPNDLELQLDVYVSLYFSDTYVSIAINEE